MLTSNPSQFSDYVYYVGSAISWLEDVFEGLVDTLFSNWLLAGFLYTLIFLTVFSLVLWFIYDFSEATGDYSLIKHRKAIREAAAEEKHKQRLTEAEERYQKHKEQNRAEAAERYRQNAIIKAEEEAKKRLSFYDDDGNFRVLSYKEQKELSPEKQKVYQRMLENYVKADS